MGRGCADIFVTIPITISYVLAVGFFFFSFAAESTPNIDLYDCNYNHRPGFVAFFMVVHAFTFCVMIFLMAYQLFYQLKEKARV